jgi:Tol biopolymer transport system component
MSSSLRTGLFEAWLFKRTGVSILVTSASAIQRCEVQVFLVWCVVALVGAVAPVSAVAAFPGDNGRIAVTYRFNSPDQRGLCSSIATATPTGSLRRRVTDGCDDGDPAWSPDGSKLVFVRNGDLWQVDARGRHPRPIATESRRRGFYAFPSWSADGRQVFFVRVSQYASPRETWELHVVRRDGSHLRPLLEHPVSDYDQYPVASPRGGLVAFSSSGGIYLARSDGRSVHQLVNLGGEPDWSPDGERIVFTSGPHRIYSISVDGSDLRRLGATGGSADVPVYSPDGQKLAFELTKHSISTSSAQFTMLRPLLGDSIRVYSPNWQPR